MNTVKSLVIYNRSLNLVLKVYDLIENNPKLARDFSLCDQLKRSAVSVPANISEGYARSKKQFKNYLEISRGSANEMITLLTIVQLVFKINTTILQNEYDYLARQITSFSRSF